jgi:type IV secretion system protein VirB5
MRFRRPQLRYSETPIPVTSYQSASQVWDERIGSARVQARNWRLMAFGNLGLALVMSGALAWRAGQAIVTPYVVEVDSGGQIRAVGEAVAPYQPTDAQIGFHLAHFIINVRSLATDPVIVRQSWLEAYAFTTDQGAITLNEYARATDPFSRVGRTSVSVEVTSVVRASDNSFQVRWIERTYEHGALVGSERWTAILSLVIQAPRTEERLRRNPLGIYVNGLSWSKELTSESGGRKP